LSASPSEINPSLRFSKEDEKFQLHFVTATKALPKFKVQNLKKLRKLRKVPE